MMSSSSSRNRYPFTASQWQELEHQALVFKYMVSGMSIPPDLLFTIRRSLDSSLSSKFLIHQPQHSSIGWNSFHMGFGRKIDPEPGRCRRTDGKKWRCSKEAYTDSKYCERHMHRGRNRSRKPVEIMSAKTLTTSPLNANPIANTTNTATLSLNKTTHLSSSSSSPTPHSMSYESQFLYPHLSRPQESTTNFFMESNNAYSHSQGKDYRDLSDNSSVNDSTWQLAPLTMGSSLSQMKQNTNTNTYSSGFSNLNDNMSFKQQKQGHHYYNSDMPFNIERDRDDHQQQPKKVMHHFLDDEWPPKDKSSWINTDQETSMSSHKTQLSISTPSPLHDFFMTQK